MNSTSLKLRRTGKILISFFYLIFLSNMQAIGPKKFVKEGFFWCRDRETHPGTQCCDSVSDGSPFEIPMLGTVNSNVKVVNKGFGHACRTSCECNTILPEVKCKQNLDCVRVGPKYLCYQKKCKFPCTYNSDCEVVLSKDYVCRNKLCTLKNPPAVIKP